MKLRVTSVKTSHLAETSSRVAQSEISKSIIPQKARKYQCFQELPSMHHETQRIRFAPLSRFQVPQIWLRFANFTNPSHQRKLASFLRISPNRPPRASQDAR